MLYWLGAVRAYVSWYEPVPGALYESCGFADQEIGRAWRKFLQRKAKQALLDCEAFNTTALIPSLMRYSCKNEDLPPTENRRNSSYTGCLNRSTTSLKAVATAGKQTF